MKKIPAGELLEQKARKLTRDAKAEDLTRELIKMGVRMAMRFFINWASFSFP